MQRFDNIRIGEELLANGQLVGRTNSADIIGEVEVLYSSKYGKKPIFTRTLGHNDLLVTGSVFMSEKVNNFRSSFKTVPLDLELGIHTADEITVDSSTVPMEKIAGIMVGNGGAGDTYNTVYKVQRHARTVPGYLPFRVVPVLDDLDPSDRVKYILRAVKGDYVYYYGKKFDTEREIEVQYEDGTIVPVDVDTLVVDKFIKIFSKYVVTVDQRDIREFFKITQGSTLRSLINSVGLITGYPGDAKDAYEEFFNVRTMTTMNMENQELKDSEATITFIYRLLIQ